MKKDKLIGILIYTYIIVLLISCFFSFFNKTFIYLFGVLIGTPILVYLLIHLIKFFSTLIDGFKEEGVTFFNTIFTGIYHFLLAIILGTTVLAWYIVPLFYFKEKTSIYYTICLPILGGAIGEIIWIALYIFGWGYIGYKIAKRIQNILKRFGIK